MIRKQRKDDGGLHAYMCLKCDVLLINHSFVFRLIIIPEMVVLTGLQAKCVALSSEPLDNLQHAE